jgi:hypothetical protein
MRSEILEWITEVADRAADTEGVVIVKVKPWS